MYNRFYLRGDLNWLEGIISPLSSDKGSVRIDLFLRPQATTTAAALDKEKWNENFLAQFPVGATFSLNKKKNELCVQEDKFLTFCLYFSLVEFILIKIFENIFMQLQLTLYKEWR